jgi:hypothetical protein
MSRCQGGENQELEEDQGQGRGEIELLPQVLDVKGKLMIVVSVTHF